MVQVLLVNPFGLGLCNRKEYPNQKKQHVYKWMDLVLSHHISLLLMPIGLCLGFDPHHFAAIKMVSTSYAQWCGWNQPIFSFAYALCRHARKIEAKELSLLGTELELADLLNDDDSVSTADTQGPHSQAEHRPGESYLARPWCGGIPNMNGLFWFWDEWFLLVGGLEHELYFPYIGNNHPNWLSYFSEGLKPPTSLFSNCHSGTYSPFSDIFSDT